MPVLVLMIEGPETLLRRIQRQCPDSAAKRPVPVPRGSEDYGDNNVRDLFSLLSVMSEANTCQGITQVKGRL